MRLFSILIFFLVFFSCTTKEKNKEVKLTKQIELSKDSKIFYGNRLFSEKKCITCHAINKKKIGPSVVEIIKVYNEKNGNIIAFLKGKSKPIVDTNSSQVAIMKANIDGFLKEVGIVELDAISTYMLHVNDLKNK